MTVDQFVQSYHDHPGDPNCTALEALTGVTSILLPTVQRFERQLGQGPQKDEMLTHKIPLLFKGPVRNISWMLTKTNPPPLNPKP